MAQLPSVPADVQREYHKWKTDPHQITAKRDIFGSLLKSSLEQMATRSSGPPCFILLDAFDEFLNDHGEERERER